MRIMVAIVLLIALGGSHAVPVGTAFTYQGELKQLGTPANGDFDFQFELYDVDADGTTIANTVQLGDVPVIDGVFTVELDFGTVPFAGDQLWLAISVREGTSSGDHTLLSPRQKVTAVPYALHAEFVAMNAVGSAEVDSTQVQLRVDGTCAAGSSIRVIGSDGMVTCETDDVGLTSVTGADIEDGSVSADDLGIDSVGSAEVDSNQVQLRVDGSCALGSSIRAIGGDGTVTCEDDDAGSGASAVHQVVVHADFTGRSTASGNPYYFGALEFEVSITPKMADSLISIDLDVFGEPTSQNTSAILQYAVAGGSWTDFDNTNVGQPGHLQLGHYPDTDYNSTPHNTSTSLAKAFNTTDTVSFRLVVYNGGTMYWNGSVNSLYESAPSQIRIIEWEASAFQYTKR